MLHSSKLHLTSKHSLLSIPLEETIQIAAEELFNNRNTTSNLNKEDFVELLTVATTENCFLFNGQYYNQSDGVAMGNPLGPTMANIFMSRFEKDWLETCPLEFKPKYYKRYVDDIFVLFNEESHLNQFSAYFNSCHPNIKFTTEIEKDGCLPFLDIKIFVENNNLHTSVYRKKTFTGIYSNFSSSIPTQYKFGLIFTLLFRFYSICSNWKLFHLEINKLKSILLFNGYPQRFIDICVKKFLLKIHNKDVIENEKEDDKTILTLSLPFLGNMSLKMKKNLNKIIKENIPNCKFRIIFSSKRRIRNYFQFKDKIPYDLQSHLVYKIMCDKCNLVYYGLCERHSKVRFFDHLGLSIYTGKPIKGVETAMKKHCHDENHEISVHSFTTIAREENSFKLRIKESLLIKRDTPKLNNNLYSTPLYLF